MVENEIKYIARWDANFERSLSSAYGFTYIEQAYLPNDRARIRKKTIGDHSQEPTYVFTYKQRLPNGRNIEIETDISKTDYFALLDYCTTQLTKKRITVRQDKIRWDIDFPIWKHGCHFVVAEAEMPDYMDEPDVIFAPLQPHIVYAVPRSDRRFTAKRLADEKSAMALAYGLGLR